VPAQSEKWERKEMKKVVLSAVIGTLLAAGVAQSHAQTTNVTVKVNVALSGAAQNGDAVEKVKITTADVVKAIGDASGTQFGAKSTLLVSFASDGSDPVFIIRDGSNSTPVDAAVFGVAQVSSVTSEKTGANGLLTGSSTSIQHFVLNTPTLALDLQGYTTATTSNKGNGKDILDNDAPVAFRSSVNGTGTTAAGLPAVLTGSISGNGRKIELF
jgi:hypothetical protein